jgi:hypothetical protein
MVSATLSAGKKWTARARQSWVVRDVLVPLIISRLALVLVAWLAMTMLHHVPRSGAWEIGRGGDIVPVQDRVSPTQHPLINMWSRWDAGWYYGIAEGGYKFSTDQQSNAAFFPVYPMLIRAVHVVIGSHRAMWWFVCGIIVSNAALVVALIYLFLLVRLEFDEQTARRAVLYFLIFPTTLFLSAVYAESVLLAFVLGSFYHARKGEWWIAGILGCVATASRPPGAVLGLGLLVEYLLQAEFNWRKARPNILALGLVPLGLIGFFTYMHYAAGTGTAATQAQYVWGLRLQDQWHTLAPFFQRGGTAHGTLIDLAFTLAFAALAIIAAFRLRASYVAYAIAYIIFITMWGSLESIPRYVLGCFPAFFLLALAGRNDLFHRWYVPISSGLAAVFMAVFAVWGWLA